MSQPAPSVSTGQAAAYVQGNASLRAAVGAVEGEALSPEPLGMGEHNVNFRFAAAGCSYVLRVNVAAQPFHDNQVAYEYAALKALEPSGCTPKAVYLDDSAEALGKGVLVETFCDGALLDFDRLGPHDLECAAKLMADVHAVPVSADCALHRPADPLRELFQECLQRYDVYRASATQDERVTRWVEHFVAAAQQALDQAGAPADCNHIVNTEPLPSHFLINVDPATPRPEPESTGGGASRCARQLAPGAFIDWERPIVGEVAQDAAYFTAPTTTFWDSDYLFPKDEVQHFVELYWQAVDGRFARGAFDRRFRAYRALTALRSITWCCRALVHYRHPENHQTQRTLEKLPVYLSDEFLSKTYQSCFK